VFTRLKRNVLVDDDGVARLGGLGSVFPLSFPASWSDVGAEKLFCGTAPELINPGAFGLVQARTTKATDMFAFGLLAWEVSRILVRLSISKYSCTGIAPRSLPACHRSLE